jgi:uncharacterized protein DUF2334
VASDVQRNLSLHAAGAVSGTNVPAVLRGRPVPSRPVRAAQRVAMKLGRLDWEDAWLEPLIAARQELLGAAAEGPPRFLVRVDEFPCSSEYYHEVRWDVRTTERFHETLAGTGVTYLMAVLPEPALDPLNPQETGTRELSEPELELLGRMRDDGVAFAQHGTTHRTRKASPRRHSELTGLSTDELHALLERGRALLADAGIGPRVFVPPFNRFDASQYEVLAERFDVICGGPESVPLVGFHGGPLWRGEAIYLPSYPPLYASARDVLPAARRLIERRPGTWIPITLHSVWETEDEFESLRELGELIAPYSASWDALVDEVASPRR